MGLRKANAWSRSPGLFLSVQPQCLLRITTLARKPQLGSFTAEMASCSENNQSGCLYDKRQKQMQVLKGGEGNW